MNEERYPYDERAFLHEQLRRLQESYARDAKPFLERLAYIESMRQPYVLFLHPRTQNDLQRVPTPEEMAKWDEPK